jgi:hypothetical protein
MKIIIVDTFNIFQNLLTLILTMSVTDYNEEELTIIKNIITKEFTTYTQRISLFKKIIKLFYSDNAIFIFVMQGKNNDAGSNLSTNKCEIDNCQIIEIFVPCVIYEEKIKRCDIAGYKNESDDVVALMIYDYLLENHKKNTKFFWTCDNYDWYKGNKDNIIIKLIFDPAQLDKINVDFIRSTAVYKRKNMKCLYELIYFNDNKSFSHKHNNYLRIVEHITKKYYAKKNINITNLVDFICNIYIRFITRNKSSHSSFTPITDTYELDNLIGDKSSIIHPAHPSFSNYKMHDIDVEILKVATDISSIIHPAHPSFSSFSNYRMHDKTMEQKYIKYKLKYLLLKKSIKKNVIIYN